jgi:hypothetical protein
LCQRYYQLASRYEEWAHGAAGGTSSAMVSVALQQVMRGSPTITLAPAGSSTGQIAFLTSSGSTPSTIGTNTALSITPYGFRINGSGYTSTWSGSGVTTAIYAYTNPTTVYTASAEL